MHEILMWGGQLGSIASKGFTGCRNYKWEILVAFWPKRDLRSNLRVPNFIFLRPRVPRSISEFHDLEQILRANFCTFSSI